MKWLSTLLISLFLFCLPTTAELKIMTNPKVAWQGKVLVVKVPAKGMSKVDALFLSKKYKFFKKGDFFKGIVGVPINQKPGHYKLKLFVARQDGSKEQVIKKMKVWETKFPFTKFWLKPARNKLRARKIVNNEWAEIEKTLLVENPKQRWKGKFTWPVKGPVSQGFGHRQIINNKRSGNHRGVDIAIVTGTKINAPNDGKVVFAKKMKAFGGTIVLDHGHGIHTLYFHLSKFMAKVGQNVSKGDLIALSGNSGISSGAHLHWGMSVHNLRVDPMQWVKHEL